MAASVGDYEITPPCRVRDGAPANCSERRTRVLAAPQQRYAVGPGRDVLKSKLPLGGKIYLVRVFIDIDCIPAEVVTVYRTSQIARYWRAM